MRSRAPAPRTAALPVLAFLLLPAPGVQAQWLSAPGEGWVEAAVFYHDTQRTYDQRGTERDIFAGGRAITRSIFFTAVTGVWDGVDIWVQIPVHSLRFDDAGGERVSRGLGDPQGFVRVGPGLFDALPDWPVALRGGVKLDGGSFDVDAEIIPLGEGQMDWELILELGRSFHPLPFWTAGWVGHRWRRENTETLRKPGDEWFWLWSVGGEVGPVGWKVTLEGLRGDPWIIQTLEIRSARRSLDQFFVEVDYGLGPGRLSAGIRSPFRGRNLPSGTALTAGYFLRFGGD